MDYYLNLRQPGITGQNEQESPNNVKNCRRKVLWIALLAVFTTFLNIDWGYAQAPGPGFRVKGLIVDSLSGKGLPFVTIQIQNVGEIIKRLSSDDSGNFNFVLNSSGNYDLLFHSIGYQEKRTAITSSDSSLILDFGKVSLSPSNELVGEVTVSAIKPLVRSESEKLVYNVESDPESATSNAMDMLRKVPMVSVDAQDNIQLRGILGVKFLINGKASPMLDQNLKEVLRGMPSNTIKEIEVITSPSSKYEAEGSAGIINIITTRKAPDGFSGGLNAGVTSRKSYNGNLFFTSKIQKFIYSVNLSINHWNNEDMFNESSRENFVSTSNRYSLKKWFGDGSSDWNTINTDASYEIDTLNLISLSLAGRLGELRNHGHTEVMDYDFNYSPSMGFQNWFTSGVHYNFLSGNIDYQKLFRKAGNSLIISYRYDYSPGDQWSNNDVLGTLNFQDYQQQISSDMTNNEGTLQIDYVHKINKTRQLEAGYKQIRRKSYSDSNYLLFDQAQDSWVQDSMRMNDLDYRQSVLGLYFQYDLKIKKTGFKAGLRGENTINHGFFQSQKDTTFTNRMFNLVPYLFFSANFDKGKSLNLSYTQRLTRPGIGILNPFRNDADPQNIRSGNPNLETEISHNFDVAFNRFSQKYNFSASLNGAFSGNRIVYSSNVQPNGVRYYTFENTGDDRLVGLSIYGSSQLTKKLNINSTVGGNFKKVCSINDEGATNAGWNYNGKIDITFKPGSNTTILAGAGGNTGSLYFQLRNHGYYWSYLTFQQDLLKKKLKLEARWEGPFEKYQYYKSDAFSNDFLEKNSYRYYSRILSFKVSYNFGSMKEQVKKAKKSIRNDDLKQQ